MEDQQQDEPMRRKDQFLPQKEKVEDEKEREKADKGRGRKVIDG